MNPAPQAIDILLKHIETSGFDSSVIASRKAIIVSPRLPNLLYLRCDRLAGNVIDIRSLITALSGALKLTAQLDTLVIRRLRLETDLLICGDFGTSSIIFSRCYTANTINLAGASIGSLIVKKSTVGGIALEGIKARRVVLSEALVRAGLALDSALIGSDIHIQYSSIGRQAQPGTCLTGKGLRAQGDFVVGPEVKIRGDVILDAADVGQNFIWTDVVLRADRPVLVRAHHLKIANVLMMAAPEFVRRRLSPLDGSPQEMQRVNVWGQMDLRGLQIEGDAVFSGWRIDTGCDHKSHTPSLIVDGDDQVALSLHSAKIAGRLYLDRGFRATGGVIATNSTIGSDVLVDTSQIGSESTRTALGFGGAQIEGSVFIGRRVPARDQARIAGEIRMKFANVREDVYLSGVSFWGSPDCGLEFRYANIRGTLTLPSVRQRKPVPLTNRFDNADVRSLDFDTSRSWPPHGEYSLDGFNYQIAGMDIDKVNILQKILLKRGISGRLESQPFDTLAQLCREGGYDGLAKRLLVEREKIRNKVRRESEAVNQPIRLRKLREGLNQDSVKRLAQVSNGQPSGGLAQRIALGIFNIRSAVMTGVTMRTAEIQHHLKQFGRRTWQLVYAGSGYGYQPERVLILLMICWLGISVGLKSLGGERLFVPSETGILSSQEYQSDLSIPVGYPKISIYSYAFDLIVPVIDFGVQSKWRVGERPADSPAQIPLALARVLVIAGRLLGWICMTLIVASVATTLKR